MSESQPGEPGMRRRRAGVRGRLAGPLSIATPAPRVDSAAALAELRQQRQEAEASLMDLPRPSTEDGRVICAALAEINRELRWLNALLRDQVAAHPRRVA